jgi:hypothetical protein
MASLAIELGRRIRHIRVVLLVAHAGWVEEKKNMLSNNITDTKLHIVYHVIFTETEQKAERLPHLIRRNEGVVRGKAIPAEVLLIVPIGRRASCSVSDAIQMNTLRIEIHV